MSSVTFYKWRAKYGGMDASMTSHLKELEAENQRLLSESRGCWIKSSNGEASLRAYGVKRSSAKPQWTGIHQ